MLVWRSEGREGEGVGDLGVMVGGDVPRFGLTTRGSVRAGESGDGRGHLLRVGGGLPIVVCRAVGGVSVDLPIVVCRAPGGWMLSSRILDAGGLPCFGCGVRYRGLCWAVAGVW
jgi:hypothetical protein